MLSQIMGRCDRDFRYCWLKINGTSEIRLILPWLAKISACFVDQGNGLTRCCLIGCYLLGCYLLGCAALAGLAGVAV
jgi:hypothetical protein